jgi:hypothetical protein
VGFFAERADDLQSLDLSGCELLDDQAVDLLTLDPERQEPRNRALRVCGSLVSVAVSVCVRQGVSLRESVCVCAGVAVSDL